MASTSEPAEKAGIRVGDTVTGIDGKSAGEYRFWDLVPFLEREGKKVEMLAARGGEELEVSIILQRVI